ncbi:hypothetical protein [Candidatus Kuenenia stuttgartiensis]|nr:hypothetical protein [Candidatus Kuenenia stuttgartiensis]
MTSKAKENIMIAEFSAALSSVKVLGEILKATKDLKNSTEFTAAVTEVYNKLHEVILKSIAGLEKVDSFKTRISELEKEITDLKNWDNEAKRYALSEICSGVVNFTVQKGQENSEPFHRLCANCFSKRQKGYLQQSEMTYEGIRYKCSCCDKELLDYSHKVPLPSFNRPP